MGPLAKAAKEVEKAEATLSTMLVLMANLVESPIMQASPGATHLLTIPLNEEDQETNAAWKTPENFLDSLKVCTGPVSCRCSVFRLHRPT